MRTRVNVMVYQIETNKGKTADGYNDDRETGDGLATFYVFCGRKASETWWLCSQEMGIHIWAQTDFLRRWNVSKMLCIFNMSGPHLNCTIWTLTSAFPLFHLPPSPIPFYPLPHPTHSPHPTFCLSFFFFLFFNIIMSGSHFGVWKNLSHALKRCSD